MTFKSYFPVKSVESSSKGLNKIVFNLFRFLRISFLKVKKYEFLNKQKLQNMKRKLAHSEIKFEYIGIDFITLLHANVLF